MRSRDFILLLNEPGALKCLLYRRYLGLDGAGLCGQLRRRYSGGLLVVIVDGVETLSQWDPATPAASRCIRSKKEDRREAGLRCFDQARLKRAF